MHPELMETLITVGDRDVDLLNDTGGAFVVRRPYLDLDSPLSSLRCLKGS